MSLAIVHHARYRCDSCAFEALGWTDRMPEYWTEYVEKGHAGDSENEPRADRLAHRCAACSNPNPPRPSPQP